MEGCEIFVRLRAARVVPLAWATDAVAETASAPSVAEHPVADRLRGYPQSDITNVRIRAPKPAPRAHALTPPPPRLAPAPQIPPRLYNARWSSSSTVKRQPVEPRSCR